MSEYSPHDNSSNNEHYDSSPDLPEQNFDEFQDTLDWNAFYDSIDSCIVRLAKLRKEQTELLKSEAQDEVSLQKAREIDQEIEAITVHLRIEWTEFFTTIGICTIRLELSDNDDDALWHSIANQLRPIPGLIAGDKLPQDTRDYLREQFELVSPTALLRTAEL